MFWLFGIVQSQSFVNSDLSGTLSFSIPPNGWLLVPMNDPNCIATFSNTADITGLTGPSTTAGIIGNPYSGTSFVSGLMSELNGAGIYHEGIMQTVSGFIIDTSYTINFYQSVVKQFNCLDPYGSWAIYIDSTLAGVTNPTLNGTAFNSTSFIWEARSVSFTATDTVHTIKFLPFDNDPDINSSQFNNNGGLRMGIDLITFCSPPVIDIGNDTILCEGDVLSLSASYPGATYLWQNNASTPIVNITQSGTYWVRVSLNDCSMTDSINVTFNPSPLVNLGSDTALCTGETLILDAMQTNSSYLWQDNTIDSTFVVSQSGLYWVEAINDCGVSSDTISISYNPIPSVFIGSDTSLCIGQTITLDANYPNANYLWQDNSTNSTLDVSQPGWYWVWVTSNNCSIFEQIDISFNTLPYLGVDTSLCEGGTITLDAGITNSTYLWHDNSTQSSFEAINTGIYWVEVTNNCGVSYDTLVLTYNPLPNISLNSDSLICLADSVIIEVYGGDTYFWPNSNDIYIINDSSIFFFPNSTSSLVVSGQDLNGCVNTDTIILEVKELPIIEITAGNNICLGDSLLLTASGGDNYLWGNVPIANQNDSSFWYRVIGDAYIQVSVSDLHNCISDTSFEITSAELPEVAILGSDSFCFSDSVFFVGNGANKYTWIVDLGFTSYEDSINMMPMSDFAIMLIGESINGCLDTVNLMVNGNEYVNPEIVIDSLLSCDGVTYIFENINSFGSNLWIDNNVENQGLTFDYLLGFNESSEIINLFNNSGCVTHTTFSLNTNRIVNYFEMSIPNIFTPNNDDVNDLYYLNIPDWLKMCPKISIFNRWGQVVYHNNLKLGWDGKVNDQDAPEGVYYILVELDGYSYHKSIRLSR